MKKEKCESCAHSIFDGHSLRCSLTNKDAYTGKQKSCSKVTAAECKQNLADFADGKYKTLDEIEPESLADIIARAQRRGGNKA